MRRLIKKEQILTLPNLLSLIRLLLIPVIVWLYCVKKEYSLAVGVIILSGATDIADGFIARRFNMVSDFGKILDPIADKLTQAAVILCLSVKYKLMYALVAIFAVKETVMLILGCLAIKLKNSVNSARWYGKLATVTLYAVMALLIILPNIPINIANALIVLCGAAILFSLVMYIIFYIKLFKIEAGREKLAA